MNTTDLLAIIGATTGCIALFWDIFKWANSGAKIKLKVAGNMILIGGINDVSRDQKNVSVEVVNSGDKKTTITHLSIAHYSSTLKAFFRRPPDLNFMVPDPGYSKLPYSLDVGDRWIGFISQTSDIEKLASDGYLYVGIYHSTSNRFIRQRLRIKKSE